MKKLYLVVLSTKFDREEVIKYLEDLPSSGMWFYNMPNSFFIRSRLSAKELYSEIVEQFGKYRCFLTEVDTHNRQGWMPGDHWDLFFKE